MSRRDFGLELDPGPGPGPDPGPGPGPGPDVERGLDVNPGLEQGFKEPPREYRGVPFWSWNDAMDPDELVRQVHDMREHGMGGFFMHSRDGLETGYLGPEWMEYVRRVADASGMAGMNAWLYDEDRWPSGYAGGRVSARIGDEGRAKGLVMHVVRGGRVTLSGNEFAVFRAVLDGRKVVSLRRAGGDAGLRFGPGEVALVFRRELPEKLDRYNGDCYGDNLNPKSVRTFIDTTYEAYLDQVGDRFGGAIPGIFTDEPHVAGFLWSRTTYSRAIPWTDGFPSYFRERRGYEFADVVAYVFLDGEGSVQARHDYWRTVSELFVEAYSKQLGDWCERHGLALTGHYLCENDFADVVRTAGAIMPHYEYQHVPGIDILTESTREILTVKQCSSVANQFGRRRVLSELYGCCGWDFTFEGQKWVGDWQYALGVNLRCQHLALYSLRGCRKRDYPPSFNYNTTWWKYNKVVEDYFARLSFVLSSGRAVRDILVVHPIASAWCVFDGESKEEADRIGRDFQGLAATLLALHRDFDLGDESLMEKYGSVVATPEGMPGAGRAELAVNRASYKVVVLPPMLTVRGSTVKLLVDFLDGGGRVIAIRPHPTLVDARPSAEPGGGLLERLTLHPGLMSLDGRDGLGRALDDVSPRRVSIQVTRGAEAESFLYMERACGRRSVFFIVNNAKDRGYEVDVALAGKGTLEEWDPLTGGTNRVQAQADESDGSVRFKATFGPAGARLYVVDPAGDFGTEGKPAACTGPGGRGAPRVKRAVYFGPVSRFRRTDPNILVLDACRFRLEGEPWSEGMPVWVAQKTVRERLGMRSVHTNRLEQRWRWVGQPHPKDGTPVGLRFQFRVKDLPSKPTFLVLEGAADFAVRLNGEAAGPPDGWYLDRSFHRIPLPELRPGGNELVLDCGYRNRMELEDCFIIGEFGVDALTREITAEPRLLRFGDWCLQGYPSYAGSMIYEGDVDLDLAPAERAVLTLDDYSATHVAIWVNSRLAAHVPWRCANGVDVTGHLTRGLNTIGIEVVGSPRNMLGPLHRKPDRSPWTDADSFRTQGEEYTPDCVLKPYGLFGQVRLDILEGD